MVVGAIWGTATTMTAMNVCCATKQSGGNMSKYTEKEIADAKAVIRSIMGPPHRDLEGEEYKHVQLMLALLEPYEQTNNQHTWTDCYKIGDIEYHVTSWPGNSPPTIAEYLLE